MKTLLLCFTAFCCSAVGIAQSQRSIDVVVGGDYTYRYLVSSGIDDLAAGMVIPSRNEREQGVTNWRIGFNVNQQVSERFFLKVGVRAARLGYGYELTDTLRWGSDHDGMGRLERRIKSSEN